MTLKKRLFWSYFAMFVLPLLAYLLVSWLSDKLLVSFLLAQTYYSLDDFQNKLAAAQRIARYVTVGVMLLTTGLTGLFLSNGILKRIADSLDQLSKGLGKLSAGDLTVRLPEDEDDEFSVVRADFNTAARKLNSSVEQVRQNEKNRQELLAGISHDLRSPLTSIRAYTEGLMDGVAQTEEARTQYLTIIRDKTLDMQALVERLFLFSRMDLGHNQDHPEIIVLGEEIRLICSALSPEYSDRGLNIVFSSECASQVVADPDTIQRIVSNIAENSLKYRQGENAELDIRVRGAEKYVSVTFTDNGPGVDPEALPKLFDAFYRSDPSRTGSVPGSGLGLAIVSRAVRNMDGRITARNVQPHGLQLEICLPKCRED